MVKGYAGRVKKMKQMRAKMESNLPNGKSTKNAKQAKTQEVLVETEHGNMMIKGGVDLKKLFLS